MGSKKYVEVNVHPGEEQYTNGNSLLVIAGLLSGHGQRNLVLSPPNNFITESFISTAQLRVTIWL